MSPYFTHRFVVVLFFCSFVSFFVYYTYQPRSHGSLQNELLLQSLCNCDVLFSDDAQAEVLHTSTGKKAVTVSTTGTNGQILGVSPDGAITITYNADRSEMLFFSSQNGKQLGRFPLAKDQFAGLWAWSADGSKLIFSIAKIQSALENSIEESFVILDWRLNKVTRVPVAKNHPIEPPYSLSVSNDGEEALAIWATGQSVELFSWNGLAEMKKVTDQDFPTNQQVEGFFAQNTPIVNHKSLIAINMSFYVFDVQIDSITAISGNRWSLSPFSPVSPNGQTVLFLQHKIGEAYASTIAYNFFSGQARLVSNKFILGDGFAYARWLPDSNNLIYENYFRHERFLINLDRTEGASKVKIPNVDFSKPITGYLKASNESGESLTNTSSKIYTSPNLGINFTYATQDLGQNILTQEIGDKVYIYSEGTELVTGQSVQVFSKEPNETLAQAVAKKFLSGYSKTDCYVQSGTDIHATQPDSGVAAVIAFPVDQNATDDGLSNAKKCPTGYALTNGLSYFWTEAEDSDKFVFFSIGQYNIPSSMEGTSWHTTLQFTK